MKFFLFFFLFSFGFTNEPFQNKYKSFVIAHEFLEGIFYGLHRESNKDINNLSDVMKYFDQNEIESYIDTIENIITPFNPSKIVMIMQKGMNFFSKAQMFLHDIDDIKNSQELSKFIDLIKNKNNQFNKFLPLISDTDFQKNIVELVFVYKTFENGGVDWKFLGRKFAEILNLIIIHSNEISQVGQKSQKTTDDLILKKINDNDEEIEKFLGGFYKGYTKDGIPQDIPNPTKYIDKKALIAFINSIRKFQQYPKTAIFGFLSSGMILFSPLEEAVREMGKPMDADKLVEFIKKLFNVDTMKKLIPAIQNNNQFIDESKQLIVAYDSYEKGQLDYGFVGLKLGDFTNVLIDIVEN